MKILIVIPCYNEEEVLPKTLDVLGALIRKIKKSRTRRRHRTAACRRWQS